MEWETPIHVVVLKDQWVCERIADNLAKELPDCTVGESPREDAINVYVPYLMWRPEYTDVGRGSVALFTHREQGDSEVAQYKRMLFDTCAKSVGGAWCMSRSTSQACEFTAPVMVEHLAADDTFERGPLVLGVCAREYVEARKNLPLLDELAKIHNVRVAYTGGVLPTSLMASWMQGIDYLVVTGQNEGGPMPVLEAMRMHKPVIAPDVGWCWDYPVLRYESDSQLIAIVERLSRPKSWRHVARQVAAFARESRHAQ